MWAFSGKIRTFLRGTSPRPLRPRAYAAQALDWLPPVLGPNDWSIGIMADRSASWYFDRDKA